MKEQLPSQERPDKLQQVIDAVRSKGLQDPEVRELYTEWVDGRQKQVENIPDSEREQFVRAQIQLNIEIALVYLTGGDVAEGREGLLDTRMQAEQEGFSDLVNKIDETINQLDESFGSANS